MSDQFWNYFFSSLPAIIISVATLAASLGGLYFSYLSTKKLAVVHTQIDGMKTELVESTAKASKAEGKAEGVKEEQVRTANGGK